MPILSSVFSECGIFAAILATRRWWKNYANRDCCIDCSVVYGRACASGYYCRIAFTGCRCFNGQEDNRRNTPDNILLDRATELNRVMFSQDDDLLIESQRRQLDGTPFAGVIYAHQLQIIIGECAHSLELIAKAATPEYLANRVEYLPL